MEKIDPELYWKMKFPNEKRDLADKVVNAKGEKGMNYSMLRNIFCGVQLNASRYICSEVAKRTGGKVSANTLYLRCKKFTVEYRDKEAKRKRKGNK